MVTGDLGVWTKPSSCVKFGVGWFLVLLLLIILDATDSGLAVLTETVLLEDAKDHTVLNVSNVVTA